MACGYVNNENLWSYTSHDHGLAYHLADLTDKFRGVESCDSTGGDRAAAGQQIEPTVFAFDANHYKGDQGYYSFNDDRKYIHLRDICIYFK